MPLEIESKASSIQSGFFFVTPRTTFVFIAHLLFFINIVIKSFVVKSSSWFREFFRNHKDVVVRITFLQNLINRVGNKALDSDNPGGRFLVLSKEGTLGIYGSEFELQKTLNVR